ncbi:MAG: VWA domain-containing protein [Blastocatellia bacterium]
MNRAGEGETGRRRERIIVAPPVRRLAFLLGLIVAFNSLAQAQASKRRPGKPGATGRFEQLAKQAHEAREANQTDTAITLYNKALKLRPGWDEGWWNLGTLLYDLERHAEARDALRKLAAIKPDGGPTWALIGLCEFQMREYQQALLHVARARTLGLGGNEEFSFATNYHAGLLMTRFERFEAGFEILSTLARSHPANPAVVEAFGINLLRLPFLPAEMPPEKRELVLRMGRAGDHFVANAEMQTQGFSAVYSLISLIYGQRALAGRKTVLYFSEGMVVPPNLIDPFRTAISAANRSNVSFYAVDARGLDSGSDLKAQSDTLLSAVRESQQQQMSRGGQAVTFGQAGIFDTAENSLRKNKRGTLAELAEGTGGFLIANTNDMRKPMQRIAVELASYYELFYVPPAREYDGKFHAISVKTPRPDIVVQSRSGYFALPPIDGPGQQMMPFEMPLLSALSTRQLPREFEFRSLSLRFAAGPDGVQQMLIVEAPLANLTFKVDEAKKLYYTRGAVLALVKSPEGRVVRKLSQDFPLEGPTARLDALKRGNLVFNRSFKLALDATRSKPPSAITRQARSARAARF